MPEMSRTVYEKVLQARLTEAFADEPRVVVTRNTLSVRASEGKGVVGTLALEYLARARGHVLLSVAPEPPALRALRQEVDPPYASQLLTDNAMAATTSGERFRTFAPTAGGAIRVPQDEAGLTAACDRIVDRLSRIFVPRVLDLADLRPGVVGNVTEEPQHYAWPVLTAVAAMRRHGLTCDDVDTERLLGRHVSRHRAFDAALLATVG